MAKKDKKIHDDEFNFEKAFSRNIGWLTELEQAQLRAKTVAIAGMGGVGGFHLLTMVRLGVTHFHIADFDEFEIHNFNRQIGANLTTLHHKKAEVLADMARNINPTVDIQIFNSGITDENLDEFLAGVDLYMDGLDFFALEMRSKVYARCRELNIPAITAGPIGMGTTYLIFMPDKMSFEEYFRFKGLNDVEKRNRFLIGIIPHMIPFKYLVDKTSINLKERRGPSTVMACEMCAGVLGTEALKILLHRGPIYSVPYYHFFDAYFGKFKRGYLRWGNYHPLQRIKFWMLNKKGAKIIENNPNLFSDSDSSNDIQKILDIARWAPSGDNCQPWRFKLVNNSQVKIILTDLSDHDIYDYHGIPTLISGGMLLENIRLAATKYGKSIDYHYKNISEHVHEIDIHFTHSSDQQDELVNFIPFRSVNRLPFQLQPLTQQQKKILEESVGVEFKINWHETFHERWDMTKLNMMATQIRLRIPELFKIHKNMIDYTHAYSEDKMPVSALGLNKLSQHLMKFSFKNWKRNHFLNQYFAVPYFVAFELDILPGLFSAAHFEIVITKKRENELSENLSIGQAIQRFWLTATKLGLVMQPTMAAVYFAKYANSNDKFTKDQHELERCQQIAKLFRTHLSDIDEVVFRGRIGFPRSPIVTSRSIRKPLSQLIIK